MIDYLTITYEIKHKPLGNILINVDVSTGVKRSYYKEIKVKSEATCLQVKSTHNGSRLEVSGNFIKFLQGHNIFGTNNLFGLAVDVIKAVTKQLSIAVTPDDRKEILKGEFTIKRVDLAENFRTFTREEVPIIIREIGYSWHTRGLNVSVYGNQTVYLNQHSKGGLKFYDKHAELSRRPLPIGISERNRLLKCAEKVVRAETTLKAEELKKNGWDTGKAWSTPLAKQILLDAIESSGIHGVTKRLLLDEEYDNLPEHVRPTYRLWLLGDNVREVCSSQKFRRHRKILMNYNIDIANPRPAESALDVDIKTIISPENMRGYPKFAKEHGLIHLPKRASPTVSS